MGSILAWLLVSKEICCVTWSFLALGRTVMGGRSWNSSKDTSMDKEILLGCIRVQHLSINQNTACTVQ